ncbi:MULTISPECIES: type II toxin-antitoxin system RelE/ParE family toxin [unclassified Pseudoalteromonas]|uniref:type II toxin-antitoxin system RelE/ParE family toxin n=1 Tax=unclassified Pseudoalteromonas TaxID=194690 RepID=UPI00110AACB3|nr:MULTISPECIES: type II toxin-antitoxin system RelE/ParE family toxin [unclassified Pseudoalteromonas]TMP46614.1 type II toxin-antitoxin system RelE/ParE family toxin [Pseudoalteromonas sp. S1650]TMP68359.1 type II toxin-antitoxin system RelE/ParE family toxin [Pseudoalteromonas sp. S1649]|tara:strand:- start:4665 stop:5006 length:342 start_codon:yes stop_codon:yes gene_type:complete
MNNVNIEITEYAQDLVKDAIKWHAKSHGMSSARDTIKATIGDWKNQLLVLPESGKQCEYYDSPIFREMIKGDYRFIYEIRREGDTFNIYLLIFCHVRMNYKTLIDDHRWRTRF